MGEKTEVRSVRSEKISETSGAGLDGGPERVQNPAWEEQSVAEEDDVIETGAFQNVETFVQEISLI